MARLFDTQQRLDILKWLNSEDCGYDLSGKMNYCDFCSNQTEYGCAMSQIEREKNSSCAKAYNKFNSSINKKKKG